MKTYLIDNANFACIIAAENNEKALEMLKQKLGNLGEEIILDQAIRCREVTEPRLLRLAIYGKSRRMVDES